MSAFEHIDLEAARKKLRDLTEVACRVLDVKILSIVSFHIEMHLIVVKAEQTEENSAPSNVVPFKPVS